MGWVCLRRSRTLDRVNLLAVDGGDGCTSGHRRDDRAAEYPISRYLYIYPNLANVADEPAVAGLRRLLPLGRRDRRGQRGRVRAARRGRPGAPRARRGRAADRGRRTMTPQLQSGATRPTSPHARRRHSGSRTCGSVGGAASGRPSFAWRSPSPRRASILISALIVLSLVGNAVAFLRDVDPAQLVADGWFPRRDHVLDPDDRGRDPGHQRRRACSSPRRSASARRSTCPSTHGPACGSTLKPILEVLAGDPVGRARLLRHHGDQPDVVQRHSARACSVFNMAAAGIARRHPDHPARSRRWPRTPCTRSDRAARGVLRPRRPAPDHEHPGRRAGRDLGHRGRAHPRRLAGHRRDDDRGHRGRRDRRLAVHDQPVRPGQTMTAAMTALATGSDQVRGRDAGLPEPVLRRPAAVRDHARPEPISERSCAASGSGTDGRRPRPARPVGAATARSRPRCEAAAATGAGMVRGAPAAADPRRRRSAILFVLLADVLSRGAGPVLTTRGLDFLTCPRTARPRDRGRRAGHLRLDHPDRSSWSSSPSRSASPPRSISRSTPATTGSRDFVNTNIRNLAGVPAIVYGLLGLAIFVTALGHGRTQPASPAG